MTTPDDPTADDAGTPSGAGSTPEDPILVRRAQRRLGSSERLDVNGDGFGDLVAHVEAADLELSASDVIAELTASRFGGRVVFGFDSIRIGR